MSIRFLHSKRFLVGILAFFGKITIIALRANLNIAILSMTSNQTLNLGNTTITQEPEFNWNSHTKGFLLGTYAYGGLLSFIGGHLAMKFGTSTVITISSLISSILTILNPFIIRKSFYLFVAIRIIGGLCDGSKFTSFLELWTHWSPARDRAKLIAITLNGMYFGPAITYPLCGIVIQKYSWPAAFYATGGLSFVWTIIWYIMVPNTPATDKWISQEELAYIQQDPPRSEPKNMISMWKNMLLSKPVHAIGTAKIVYNFGVVVVVTCLPMYIKDLTQGRIDEVSIYSAIPTAINLFTIPCVGVILDQLQNKIQYTITQVQKSFICGAFIFGGITLILMSYLPHNLTLLMIFLTVFKLAISVNYVVCNLNAIVIAPKCSGILISFLSLHHTLGSVIAPMVIAFIVTDNNLSRWNTCYITFGVIFIIEAVIFLIFGSGEPQPWAYSVDEPGIQNDGYKHDDVTTSAK